LYNGHQQQGRWVEAGLKRECYPFIRKRFSGIVIKGGAFMFTTSKIKWIGTIFLAGIILVLALMGGKWGTSYAAEAGVNAAPIIYDIDPNAVPPGIEDRVIIINGANFGDINNTGVRLVGTGIDIILEPDFVIPDGISVTIPAYLLAVPKLYILTVVKSNFPSIPTVPITPWDEESNQVSFKVYNPHFTYLSVIVK
jgi:hypothetical protein